jgi:hypothetical protein
VIHWSKTRIYARHNWRFILSLIWDDIILHVKCSFYRYPLDSYKQKVTVIAFVLKKLTDIFHTSELEKKIRFGLFRLYIPPDSVSASVYKQQVICSAYNPYTVKIFSWNKFFLYARKFRPTCIKLSTLYHATLFYSSKYCNKQYPQGLILRYS